MAKVSATRRLLLLANIFNLLVAIYFIIIAIVGLAQLRWYHQLTISVKARYFVTLSTSYFAFLILILVGLLLTGLFLASILTLANSKRQRELLPSADEDAINHQGGIASTSDGKTTQNKDGADGEQRVDELVARLSPVAPARSPELGGDRSNRLVLHQSSLSEESHTSACCYIFLHLLVCAGLIIILVIWLYNTGELVRDSISSQLEYGLARYQFSNRTNYLTVAIDAMQDVNVCCGSLDYSDFPHQRNIGLAPSHYPGSCCGRPMFGVQASITCMASEVHRSKRTTGCTIVLANYYELVSLLIVPVALVCLFVNITVIALITISKGGSIGFGQTTTPVEPPMLGYRGRDHKQRQRVASKLQQH